MASLQGLRTFGIKFASNSDEEVDMRKKNGSGKSFSLGDLIVALFEETRKVSSNRLEQRILVYAALKHLLKGRVHSIHPIALKA